MQTETIHPPWLDDVRVKRLLAAFKNSSLRFVGGGVRDALIGRDAPDIDCATPLPPQEVLTLLERAGLKAVPTGITHGTVTAIIEGKSFEITTLRRDIACDGRHAEIAYTDRWEEDALRRDFTLNALYCDANGKLYDYTGGVADALAGRIVFIGDASTRIQEDALRILRYFRFFATHARGAPNDAALAACTAHRAMLHALSGERIQQEMLKLLAAQDPLASLEAMQRSGVLGELLGDNAPLPPLAHLQGLLQPVGVADLPLEWLRLALLLRSGATDHAAIARRWRLSNKDAETLKTLCEHASDWPQDVRAMVRAARRMPPELYPLWLLRCAAEQSKDAAEVARQMEQWRQLDLPRFPLGGDDLIACGIAPGPELGRTLARLEAAWEASGYRLSKEELLKHL